MGAVYKARQTSLDRFVALKTLQASISSDQEFIARFRREAKAAASLNHPNLVQVYSAGETDGLHWFAMEYVEGESAQARVKRKERLDPAEASPSASTSPRRSNTAGARRSSSTATSSPTTSS